MKIYPEKWTKEDILAYEQQASGSCREAVLPIVRRATAAGPAELSTVIDMCMRSNLPFSLREIRREVVSIACEWHPPEPPPKPPITPKPPTIDETPMEFSKSEVGEDG